MSYIYVETTADSVFFFNKKLNQRQTILLKRCKNTRNLAVSLTLDSIIWLDAMGKQIISCIESHKIGERTNERALTCLYAESRKSPKEKEYKTNT